eukprot:1538965-Prorocentrum_lima.AAC.1
MCIRDSNRPCACLPVGTDEAYQLGEVSADGFCEGVPAHGSKRVFGFQGHHHCRFSAKVDPRLQDL